MNIFYRCPQCFITWAAYDTHVGIGFENVDELCQWCKDHPNAAYHRALLLERRLYVMDDAQMSDYPELMRHMYEVLKRED